MSLNSKLIHLEIPCGAKLQAEIPKEQQDDLIDLAFRSVLGTLFSFRHIKDQRLRRLFLIRYCSEVLALSEHAVRTVQIYNRISAEKIDKEIKFSVEKLLDSLGHKRQEDG